MEGRVLRKIFRVVTLPELMAIEPGLVETIPCIPWIDVAIPPVAYGQKAPPAFDVVETPPNNWFEKSYAIHDGHIFGLSDAVVHGELGIITVGDYLVRESLHFTFPEFHGFTWTDSDHLEMPSPERETHVERGFHAMCGYVASRNYAHWWIDVVAAIGVALEGGAASDSTLLLPVITNNYQRETLDLIPEIADRSLSGQQGVGVRCDRLFFNHRITASDYTPHPRRVEFIQELKRRAGADGGGSKKKRKLYISRRDAGARPLANVDEVESLVASHGYEVMQMTGKSIKEQIQIFSSLTHLIAPHGAGLANILFCQPYTRMLELHYDQNVNWSLRRLASVLPMTYGVVVGTSEKDDQDQAASNRPVPWSVSIAELKAAIEGME